MFPSNVAARHPWVTLGLHLLVAVVASLGLARLRESDNVMDFIPPADPDVKVFNEVARRFGALRVALIGVEAPPGEDVFSPETLKKIGAASDALKGVHGVDRVLSLTTLADFTPADGMVQVAQLIDGDHLPSSPAESAAVRTRVLGRPHVAGSFVSLDGRAALLLVFLAPASPGEDVALRPIAHELHAVAERTLGPLHIIYGGAPFAAATIFEETQRDIRRLTPIAAAIILLVILLAFRDPVGVVLTVLTVAWSCLVVVGVMGWWGEPYTVVSSTLPVILFASGSSYAVHVLGRYYALGARSAPEGGRAAILSAARIVTPPVFIAGLTTAAGFLSFLVMNIRPMRTFGVECAAGVLLCMTASLTAVPAVVTLWPRPASSAVEIVSVGRWLSHVGAWAFRRRAWLLAGSLLAALATIGPMLRIEVRMEPSAFFRPGSEPWIAVRFLDEKFGGSQFLQVAITGDLTDPVTLREVQRLADFARAQPSVSQVQSVVEPLELVSDAMGAGMRIPEQRAQVMNLLFFVDGEPSLRMVMTAERDMALLHIRIRGDVQPALAAITEYVDKRFDAHPTAPTLEKVGERVAWIARLADGKGIDIARGMAAPWTLPPEATAQARADLVKSLAPDEPTPEAFAEAEKDALRRHHAKALLADVKFPDDRTRAAAVDALIDLQPLHAFAAAPQPIVARLAGEPILERGLSRSVGDNQTRSLAVSIIAVLLLMAGLFRSARAAALSVFPAALTMMILFGAMSLMHVRIDIGTSLVGSIATGAGSDFAMHYLWYLRRAQAAARTGQGAANDEVVRFIGPIMVISAVLVGLGFAVLAMGQAQSMRLFGLLSALTMLLAAGLTFLLVPALVGSIENTNSRREEGP